MSQLLMDRLDSLRIDDPLSHASLTVFPLDAARQGALEYQTLDEAVRADMLEIGELDGGVVPRLVAVNSGAMPVLVVDGEELRGGKQDRIVNSSILLPPGRCELPVSCVEHGRWNAVSASFRSREAAYSSLRAAKAQQVGLSLHEEAGHRANQGKLWQALSERQDAMSVTSGTGAMADVYESRRDSIADFDGAMPYPEGAVGMVVAIGGRIVSLECFDSPETMRKLWSKLVRAAALDALVHTDGAQVARKHAVRMLHRAREARIERFPTPGLGSDLRVSGGGVVGAALVYEEVVVHATLFRHHVADHDPAPIASHSTRQRLHVR